MFISLTLIGGGACVPSCASRKESEHRLWFENVKTKWGIPEVTPKHPYQSQQVFINFKSKPQLALSLFLFQMGKDVNRKSRENIPINLKKEEMSMYVKRFNAIDREKKGFITVTDMTRSMKVKTEGIWIKNFCEAGSGLKIRCQGKYSISVT